MIISSAPIIIIDQNAGISRAIGQMLRPLGYTNIVYDDGPRAVEKLSADLFSLIILEWWAEAHTTNDYLADIFCCDTRFSKIPRIMLSADSSLKAAHAAKAAGASGYLVKPVKTETLQKQVLGVLGPANSSKPSLGKVQQDDKRRSIRFVQPKLEMLVNDQYCEMVNWSIGGLAVSVPHDFAEPQSEAPIDVKLKIEGDTILFEDRLLLVRHAADKRIMYLRFTDDTVVPMAIVNRIIREKSPTLSLVAVSQDQAAS